VKSLGPFQGKEQPTPAVGEKRLRECAWEPAATLEIPKDWVSGVYLAKFVATKHRYQSYCIFIVRDERPADVLFQCSTNTWQAYNKWPENHSLYDNDREDKRPLVSGVRVSFDRPYAKYPQVTDNPLSLGSGEFLLFEFPFAYWLEQHGYDVTYCSNEDVHNSLDTVTRCKVFLSVGHDEYWSRKQYDHCMEAVTKGVNFGFFSGNSCCFVTPFAASSAKVPNRVLERMGRYGGIRPGEEKWMADLPEEAPNESTLIGAQTVTPFNGSGDWVCTKPDHWIFAGTGMKKGEAIPGLVGWEFHGDPAKIAGLEVVAGLPIKHLAMQGCTLTEDSFKAFGKMTALEELWLSDVKMKADWLKHIAKLPKLKDLNLMSADFDDAAVFVGRFNHQRLVADVDNPGTIDVDELHDVHPGIPGRRHLDQGQIARNLWHLRDVVHATDGKQLVEVGLDQPGAPLIRVHHDGHAREAGLLGVPDRQRLDVERTATEQRRDAVQHARLVVDINGEGMNHKDSSIVSL
jgi:hypothetical protein